MRRAALYSAVSSKLAEGQLIIVDELNFEAPKTKEMARVMSNLNAKNALLVLTPEDVNAALSIRNINGFEAVKFDALNTYNVLYHDKLIMTQAALAAFEEVFA